jgi:hypothetical protein
MIFWLAALPLYLLGLCLARCLLFCGLFLQYLAWRGWHLRTLRDFVIFLEVVAHLLHRNPFYTFVLIDMFDDSA